MSLKRWTVPAALLLAITSCGDADDGPVSPVLDDRNEDATALQPIIADGCNAYEGACDDDDEMDTGGGGGSDYSVPGGDMSGAGGTSSGDGDGSADVDDGLALDEEWDCHIHDAFAGATGTCDLREPTEAEKEKFRQLTDEIRTDESTCQRIRDTALAVGENLMVWDNLLQVSDEGRMKTLFGDAKWDIVMNPDGTVQSATRQMHLWSGGMNARTIAHEAMHFFPSSRPGEEYWMHSADPPQTYDGRTIEEWAHHCTR